MGRSAGQPGIVRVSTVIVRLGGGRRHDDHVEIRRGIGVVSTLVVAGRGGDACIGHDARQIGNAEADLGVGVIPLKSHPQKPAPGGECLLDPGHLILVCTGDSSALRVLDAGFEKSSRERAVGDGLAGGETGGAAVLEQLRESRLICIQGRNSFL